MIMLPLLLLCMDTFDYCLFHYQYTPILLILSVIFLLYIYPVDSQSWSRDRGDTAAILGAFLGLMLGHCALGPSPDDLDPGPFSLTFPTISILSLCVVRFIVGLLLLLPIRFVMKLLCFKLLPTIMPTHGIREVGKRPLVEMPYKIITYSFLGFNILYTSRAIFHVCGISRQ